MSDVQTLMTGVALGESPRWPEDRLWFSDWGAHEVIAVDLAGKSDVIVCMPSSPFCIDWLPDGRLLIVSGRDRLLPIVLHAPYQDCACSRSYFCKIR